VFVYDVPPGVETSDGSKPLSPTLYFARLAQRLIAALTTPTAAGTLYEVDMRLRPTGNKGPVAVSLESFAAYHAHESWTWEHMALMRGRLVAGPPALRAKVEQEIRKRLTEPRAADVIIGDARDMREKMALTFLGSNPWDLKYAPGGLVDIEFIAQSFQLVHAPDRPAVLDTNTIGALIMLKRAGFLMAADADVLIASARLQHALTQVLRIALDETLKIEDATPGLKTLLTRAAEVAGFDETQARLADLQAKTRGIFNRLMAKSV
jgi:glutamate-ammonia-ligase adenylyltransferase